MVKKFCAFIITMAFKSRFKTQIDRRRLVRNLFESNVLIWAQFEVTYPGFSLTTGVKNLLFFYRMTFKSNPTQYNWVSSLTTENLPSSKPWSYHLYKQLYNLSFHQQYWGQMLKRCIRLLFLEWVFRFRILSHFITQDC